MRSESPTARSLPQPRERMPSTHQISEDGIHLVAARLVSAGAEVARLSGRGARILASWEGGADQVIEVRANLSPKPGGGKGPLALDWWIGEDSSADWVALADLSTSRVWLMTMEEVAANAQQHPAGRHHLFMVVEPDAVPQRRRYTRYLDSHFDEFLFERRFPGVLVRPGSSPD